MFYSLQSIWSLVLVVLGLGALAALSWRRPRWGALAVIFGAPLYLLKISVLPLTLLEAMLWVLAGVWLIKKIKNSESWPKIDQAFAAPLVLVLAGVVLSVIFSPDARVGLGVLKSWFIAPLFFAWALTDASEGGKKNNEILWAFFASSVLVAAISFGFFLLGHLTFDGRLAAFYLSPNHLAMWLVIGILSGLAIWFDAEKLYQKNLLFLAYGLLLAALYFTYSYGAWLGLAAAIVFIFFYFWRLKMISSRSLLIIGCLLVVFWAMAIFSPFSDKGKLDSLLDSPRSSWQSRLMVWQAAGKILQGHWLLGIGPGLFQRYYLEYQKYFPPYLEWAVPQPHNLFLAWWLQAGLAGLVGFLWLVVNFFRRTLGILANIKPSSVRSRNEEGMLLVNISLAAVMVYFLAHGLADTTFWKNDLALAWWVILFLGSRVVRLAG